MVITALGAGTAASALYPEFVGRRGIFVGIGTNGPALYSQTIQDPITVAQNPFYIDAFAGDALTVSGTYIVRFKPAGTGVRQSWTAVWYVAATGLQAAANTVLSAEKIQVGISGANTKRPPIKSAFSRMRDLRCPCGDDLQGRFS